MPVYLVINQSDGLVVNAIKWDGEAEYDPGEGFDLELVSGEPGCPWMGWTREADGSFTPPPPPVRYAVYRKDNGKVVAFKMFAPGEPAALPEPSSFEYDLAKCEDENVAEGWVYADGDFTAA